MIVENSLKVIIERFKIDLDSKCEQLKCFCKHGVQLEGWFKGELLYFLDNEKTKGRIAEFDREVLTGLGRQKVDIAVRFHSETEQLNIWIELKYWLIGYQRGTRYGPQFYFGDNSSVGIKPDVEKLNKLSNGDKFLLILTVSNPGTYDWSDGINKFNRKFPLLHLKSLTNPADFPDSYFLGLLNVTKS